MARVILALVVVLVARAALAQEPLSIARDRLLDTYAQARGLANRCDAWAFITNPANNIGGAETRKYVFLTITHNLWSVHAYPAETNGARTTPERQERITDHIEAVLGVLDDESRSCSGAANNRLYGRFDPIGMRAVRELGVAGVGMYGPMKWRDSRDLGGPHKPFTGSRESDRGGPRAQIHYFATDAQARVIGKREVEAVNHPRAFEIDLDYNWLHDSNPVCTYSGRKGFDRYRTTWGEGSGGPPVEYDYVPGGCAGTVINSGGVVDAHTWQPETSAARYVAIFGRGFSASAGANAVVFMQASPQSATSTVLPAQVVYDSAMQINVIAPSTLKPSAMVGPAYVYVISNGRRTQGERIVVK